MNIFVEANLQPGQTVLIHGAASGVGTAAIQLVREAGGRAIATAGTDEKVAYCAQLGAELAINYKKIASDIVMLASDRSREAARAQPDDVGA